MEDAVLLRINEILKEKELSVSKLSREIGVVQTTLNRQLTGVSKLNHNTVNAILNRFKDISTEWLLYGRGEMINDNVNTGEKTQTSSLPLLPFSVMGGPLTGDNDGAILDQCERYIVPDFVARGAQFLVRVSGSSMYPKYSNGDILAVRKLDDVTFFQWGKVYVLDTNQGAIIKRVFPANGNAVTCHSDNTDNYPDFTVDRDDIRAVGIVVGCIRME